ncbi:DUF2062 domain-containing protein [Desulfosarcina sp.]|uniref:DUF2062 domain-containing protein n=1 Tax=Desulfosarcina sp. TaxID=2027861 RepID=UPI003970CE5E
MFSQRIKQTALTIYDRFIKLKGAPREIALGFALGLLIGMTPFFGVHFFSSILLASLLGWSKIAAMVGVNVTNVITAPLIYPVNYWVGVRLVGFSKAIDWSTAYKLSDMLALMQQSPMILVDLSIGGIILGIPLAVAGYFVAFRIIRNYRQKTVGAGTN